MQHPKVCWASCIPADAWCQHRHGDGILGTQQALPAPEGKIIPALQGKQDLSLVNACVSIRIPHSKLSYTSQNARSVWHCAGKSHPELKFLSHRWGLLCLSSVIHCYDHTVSLFKNELYQSFEAMLTYLIGMGPVLVLGPVRCIGESFVAAFMFTHIWFLSSVRSQVRFQVF